VKITSFFQVGLVVPGLEQGLAQYKIERIYQFLKEGKIGQLRYELFPALIDQEELTGYH
jgi:hypothetical protein